MGLPAIGKRTSKSVGHLRDAVTRPGMDAMIGIPISQEEKEVDYFVER